MRKEFSRSWIKSTKPRKQRKFVKNAPLHTKGKFVRTHLANDLIKKHGKRSQRIVKGDKVKICRGQFKGRTGKIERVDVRESKVYITGIEQVRKDGTKKLQPLRPSNLVITELNLEDKKRKNVLERK